MVKTKKNVEELLNEAQAYWVCPITNKKILASDTAGIELHKSEILQKEKEKQLQKQQDKALAVLTKGFKNIDSLKELNEYIANFIHIRLPNQTKLPILSVEAIEFAKDSYIVESGRVALKIDKLTPEIKKVLKNNLKKNINAEDLNENYYVFYAHENPLGKKIYDFVLETRKNKIVKVGLKEKAQLANHPEYPQLVEKMKETKSKLHDLHIEHAQLEKEMAKIRVEVLTHRVFDDGASPPVKKLKR